MGLLVAGICFSLVLISLAICWVVVFLKFINEGDFNDTDL